MTKVNKLMMILAPALPAMLAPTFAQAAYSYTNISALTPVGTTVSRAISINAAGTVVGDYTNGGTTTFFTYQTGASSITPYPSSNGTPLTYNYSSVSGGRVISDSGVFLAGSVTNSLDGTLYGGFYTPSTSSYTQLPNDTTYQYVAAGGANSSGSQIATTVSPTSINASNYIVGSQIFIQPNGTAYPNGNEHGYIYNPTTGTGMDIGGNILPGTGNATFGSNSLNAISNNNIVVGDAVVSHSEDAFVGMPNGSGGYTYSDLSSLIATAVPAGYTLSSSDATNISGNGRFIVGTYNATNGSKYVLRSFEITDDATAVDVGGLGGTSTIIASADTVNNSGIVGGSSAAVNSSGGNTNHAFLFSNGQITDVNSLATAPGYIFANVQSIDNAGDLAGVTFPSAGGTTNSAFELTSAAPEPASLFLFLTGGSLFLQRRRNSIHN